MIIFEPPQALGGSGLPIWIGISGGPNWGGADIWVSQDNTTYQNIGRVTAEARWGKLSAALASSGTSPDTSNTLAVNLQQSAGQLTSASQNGAVALSTLSYVGGELIAYANTTLTGANQYNLTYLVRGAYGTTISSHAAGAPFLRLDNAIFKYSVDPSYIGKTLYIKFVSFNLFGNYGTQSLATVQPVNYTVTGQGISVPPAAITNLLATLSAQGTILQWTGINDSRILDYEIREGATWSQSLLAGRSTTASFAVAGAGTYWVAARVQPVLGYSVYQTTPVSVVVSQASVLRTLILNTDQGASNFPGTVSGAAGKITSLPVRQTALELGGTANILLESSFLTVGDMLFDGGVGSGIYTLPGQTNLGRVQAAQITVNVTASAISIYDNYFTIPNLNTVTDLLAWNLSQAATIQTQISLAQADHIFGSWINFQQGQVNAQYIQVRLLLNSTDPQVTMVVTGLTVTIDVAAQTLSASGVAMLAAGLTVTFATPFSATPTIVGHIIGGSPGDCLNILTQSATGFTAQAVNSSTPVARTIDWLATGT